ncbi:MAG TPA: ABC transporter permease [bacterium]|nr:ABC transporter permease [bacterium]
MSAQSAAAGRAVPRAAQAEGRYARNWRVLRRHPLAWAGGAGLAFIVGLCFLGPPVYETDPMAVNILSTLQPPSAFHPLGTDELGRDVLSRLMLGGQLSLEVGFAAALASMAVGIAYGLTAGYGGRWADTVMMRVVDLLRAVPALFLLLFVNSVFKPNAGLLIALIAFVAWHDVSRLVRAEVLSLRERTYVEASRAAGASRLRVALVHLLPNAIGTIAVTATFRVADAILLVAGLSFLGLGLPPPAPNWGAMLATSMSYLPQNAWWLVYPPGVALLLAVVSVNFLGDALREAFDTRLRRSL